MRQNICISVSHNTSKFMKINLIRCKENIKNPHALSSSSQSACCLQNATRCPMNIQTKQLSPQTSGVSLIYSVCMSTALSIISHRQWRCDVILQKINHQFIDERNAKSATLCIMMWNKLRTQCAGYCAMCRCDHRSQTQLEVLHPPSQITKSHDIRVVSSVHGWVSQGRHPQ